jgi:rod shape-determining protein MreD
MHRNKLSHIYLSLFAVYLLLLLPWTESALRYKPDFTLLVLIFWLIRAPRLCNIGTAWFIGLLVDLATGGIFGQHAWAYTVTAFFTMVYQKRLILFNRFHQFIYVFILLIIAQIVLLILKTFSGVPFPGMVYFMPSVIGVLLWSISLLFKLHTDGRPGDI